MLNRLTNNIGIKVFSLVLALLLWIYVVEYVNPVFTQALDLEIKVKNLSENYLIVEPLTLPREVRIRIKGPYASVEKLSGKVYFSNLDCSKVNKPGMYTIRLDFPDFGEIQIVHQNMDTIQIRVEEKSIITKSVKINSLGKVAAGYSAGKESVSPDSVKISGPKRIIEQVEYAQIEPDIENTSEDVANRLVKIKLYNQSNLEIDEKLNTLEPEYVNYSVSVVPTGAYKVLRVYPDLQGRLAEDLQLSEILLKPTTVIVDSELVPDNVFAVKTAPISLNSISESFTRLVDLKYDFEVPDDETIPLKCEVELEIISIEESGGAKRISLDVDGMQDTFTYYISPMDILVKSDIIDSISEEDLAQIKAHIDVTDLEPGEYRMTPQVDIPYNLTKLTLNPNTIEVLVIQPKDE